MKIPAFGWGIFLAALFFCGAADAREVQSLDGTWRIVFDADNAGRKGGWHKAEVFTGLDTQREIPVPSCWETLEKDYEGVAFYHRTFSIPEEWMHRVVHLQFDAVNFRAEVWVNDVAVGIHEGGFTPFEFRIDDLLKPDAENTLVLRVAGPILMEDKTIEGVGKMETTQWRGAITGGIWQPVRLVATGESFVDDVFIEPNISNNTAAFHLQLENTGETVAEAGIRVTVRSGGKVISETVQPAILQPGRNASVHTLKIPDAVLWSPDRPHLYTAEVCIRIDGDLSDSWQTRFGMRAFTVRDGRFALNGKPLYLKATFFEGLYPVGLAYPYSREMAVREIKLAKDAGFNMIRPWRKPPAADVARSMR